MKHVLSCLFHGNIEKTLKKFVARNKLQISKKSYAAEFDEKPDYKSETLPGMLKWLFNIGDIDSILEAVKNPSFLEVEINLCDKCVMVYTKRSMSTCLLNTEIKNIQRDSELFKDKFLKEKKPNFKRRPK